MTVVPKLAAAFMVLASLAGTSHAASAGRGVLDYKVYFGGLAAVALEVDLERAREDYRIGVSLRTLGVIDQLFPWTMRAYSRGRLAGADTRPDAAGQTSDWRGRKRLVDVRYDAGRPVVERLAPTPKHNDRAPVSEKDMRGTVDLASAVLSMTLAAERGRGCAKAVPVFDGRRRYDLVAERIGMEAIRRIGHTAHDTRALKCRISMRRLAGFKTNPDPERAGDRRRSALVWIAPAGNGMPPLPIRVEVETRFGLLIAHLVRVRGVPAGAE